MALKKKYVTYISLSVITVIIVSLGVWQFIPEPVVLEPSMPGKDNRGKGFVVNESIVIGEYFERYTQEIPNLTEIWGRFRGNQFDNIYKSDLNYTKTFEATGPEIMWKHELGEGHSGVAIYKGLVYLLDYDETQKADMLRCFNLINGTELWRRWYKVNIKRNHGISRTVPAVTDNYIVTIGPRCHTMCVDRNTGNLLWGLDVATQYETEVPLWYTGQCPIIYNNEAVIATGGKALFVGVDCKTGNINWEVPNPNGYKMSHSSIMLYEFGGHKMFVYCFVGGICAVSAEPETIGKVLWESNAWNQQVIAPSALCMPDGKIFVTAGYGAGSMMFQLEKKQDQFSIKVIDEYKPAHGLASEQQTPIFLNNHLLGIMPKDGGEHRNQLVCVSKDDTKKIIWSSNKENRFGLGPYIICNNILYLLNDDGTLVILEASTKKYTEHARYKLIEGSDAWAPIAIADGYMVLRDSKTLMCLNLLKQ